MNNFFQLFAVASKENGTGSRTVSYPNDITLHEARAIRSLAKWLIVVTRAVGVVSN